MPRGKQGLRIPAMVWLRVIPGEPGLLNGGGRAIVPDPTDGAAE